MSKEFYVAGIIITPILEIIIPKETKALKILGKPGTGTQHYLAAFNFLPAFGVVREERV